MGAYVPGTTWVPTSSISTADDATPATVASLVATDEAALDRTQQFTMAKWFALGGLPYVSASGNFSTGFNYLSIATSVSSGDQANIPLHNLVHGATISMIDVMFAAATGHAGLPAVAPSITLVRVPIVAGSTPGVPAVIATGTYVPTTLVNYNNGNNKLITVFPAHVVDAEGYVYQLRVTDESGANSIPGAGFAAARITYA